MWGTHVFDGHVAHCTRTGRRVRCAWIHRSIAIEIRTPDVLVRSSEVNRPWGSPMSIDQQLNVIAVSNCPLKSMEFDGGCYQRCYQNPELHRRIIQAVQGNAVTNRENL